MLKGELFWARLDIGLMGGGGAGQGAVAKQRGVGPKQEIRRRRGGQSRRRGKRGMIPLGSDF